MKVAERVLDVTSTIEGERIEMTLDPAATAHLMTVFTDLYSNQMLAVIREYSTNAYDAHVVSGVTRPIEVNLPTALSPFFSVRDFGEGLSVEDMREIYSKYGASTKRQSNDVVGMLGLGCKSGLTYADQFIVTSVKNGVAIQVSVSRSENGSAAMTIVTEYATDDPSGVEIKIPSKGRAYDWADTANDFFRFWKEGTIRLNGEAPKRIDGVWITSDIVMSSNLDQDYIVMGNVAYPVESTYGFTLNRRNLHIAAYVNIGDVHFVPSREALMYDAQTKKTLASLKVLIKNEMNKAFAREIENSPTHFVALSKYWEVAGMGYDDPNPTYKGERVPVDFRAKRPVILDPVTSNNIPDPNWVNPYRLLSVELGRYSQKKGNIHEGIAYTKGLSRVWIFKNFDAVEFSPTKRKKLDIWATEKMGLEGCYLFPGEVPADILKWLNPDMVHDWAEVAAIKIPTNTPKQDGHPTGSYSLYLSNPSSSKDSYPILHGGVIATDINTNLPLYFVKQRDRDTLSFDLLNGAHPQGYTVVILAQNRINKFMRDFPAAKNARLAVNEIAKAWIDSLSDDDRLSLFLEERASLSRISLLKKGEGFDDPRLVDLSRIVKLERKQLHDTYRKFKRYLSDDLTPPGWTDPLGKYVLLDTIGYYGYNEKRTLEHIILYLNAAYAAEKGA